jgi:hypothetical protein
LWLFEHGYGESRGYLVTFTGRQARFDNPTARPNELARQKQRYWIYPEEAKAAAEYLLGEGRQERDAYFGVHLFEKAGSRLSTNAQGAISWLWLDEDEGQLPEDGPEPTAIVYSSENRRHLYWRLTRPLSAEWVVAMNRRIAHWAGGDAGKAGLSSVLRVPGTVNYKRYPKVDTVRLEVTGVAPWRPEVIEQAIPPLPEQKTRTRRGTPYTGPRVDLVDYLEASNAEILGSLPDGGGTKLAVICPWIDEHSGGDRTGTYVGQYVNGATWFHCHYEHCQGRSWRDFRRACRPTETASLKMPTGDRSGRVVIRLG